MKKGSAWAFALGFLVPFLFTTGALYVTSDQFGILDSHTLLQCLLIIGAVSFLIALFTLFSSLVQEESPEQADFSGEISREAGSFFRALLFLRKPAFFPFWITLSTLALGWILISWGYLIPGSLSLLIGQIFWFLIRGRLRHFIDHAPMDNDLHPYLVWTFRGIDALCLFCAAGILGALGEFGEIVDTISLMAAASLIAVFIVGARAMRKKDPIEMDHLLQAAFLFIWVAMFLAAFNFGFDFRAPAGTKQLTYRDCLSHRDLVLGGQAIHREEMLDCHYFSRIPAPQLDSAISFAFHRGALGLRWKKIQVIK